MNFLITEKCSKGCSFCFAHKEENEMPFGDFVKYLAHVENMGYESIGILGGEPTMHSNFPLFLGHIISNSKIKHIRLFTNLFGNQNNIDFLICNAHYMPIVIVWNNTEPSKINPEDLKRSYANAKAIRESVPAHMFCMSLTLTNYNSLQDFDYIIDTYKQLGVYRLRFAIDVAQQKCFVGNNKIFDVVKYLVDHGIKVEQDPCGYPLACSINGNYEFNFCVDRLQNFSSGCISHAGGDLLPDGSLIPCMPYRKKERKLKLMDFNSYEEILNAFKREYGIDSSIPLKDRARPSMCDGCTKTEMCLGPCPAKR